MMIKTKDQKRATLFLSTFFVSGTCFLPFGFYYHCDLTLTVLMSQDHTPQMPSLAQSRKIEKLHG
jgi:hypothetical protein